MSDQRVFIEIPEHTVGVVPGQKMPFRIHIRGVAPQCAEVTVMMSDPLGRARNHMLDTCEITSAEHVHDMVWQQVRRGQPGTYRLQVNLYLPESYERIITSRPFEVVVPGHAHPDTLVAVEREDPIRCRHPFPEPDPVALRAVFDDAHKEVQAYANGDGSYGRGSEHLRGCEDAPAGPGPTGVGLHGYHARSTGISGGIPYPDYEKDSLFARL